MNKLMTVASACVCAVVFCTSVQAETKDAKIDEKVVEAARAEAAKSEQGEEDAKGLVDQMHEIFEAGFDLDFFSAYVWRNAVQTDEPVLQPCVWMDFTYFKPFWLGFYLWENWDLTSRRHSVMRGGLTENDWEVHLGATAWQSEDESTWLDLEIGHDWYTYRGIKSDYREDYKNTAELYAKATFNNEYVNVYGQVSWMYDDFGAYMQSFCYELGLNREFDVAELISAIPEEALTFGLDWNLNFGDSRYLYFLYGGVDYREGPGGEETCSNPTAGIGGTTIKAYLTWNITDWMSLGATIAYTGVLNGSSRQALADDSGWQGDPYRRDLLWGGCSLKFKF